MTCRHHKTISGSSRRLRLFARRSELGGVTGGTNLYGYAYDTIGNRTLSYANVTTNTYTANNLNQYTQVGRDAPIAPPVAFSYDADGNMTNDGRFTYTFDAENRLVSACPIVPAENALAVEHAYDHRHHCIRKTVKRYNGAEWQLAETHDFVWDGNNIILETIAFADGTMRTCEYFWGNDLSGTEQGAGNAPVAKRSGRLNEANPKGRKGPRVGGLLSVSVDGAFFIPCYDHNGNIVCYVSESGSIAAQYVYAPYGNVVEQYGSNPNLFNFGFSTKYHDRETGMLSYQCRFYRPYEGRWLNRDPIEEAGGENLYAFSGNSPSCLCDVLGLACRLGTFNVLSLVVDAKPAMNGLSYNPNLIQQGESLLQSLGMLDLLSAPASLMTGSALSRLISALDIAAGKVSSPDNNAMEQIRRLLEKLKSGSIEVYGRLEYEMCECKDGKTQMVRQNPPIADDDEIVLDATDQAAVRAAYNQVVKKLCRN